MAASAWLARLLWPQLPQARHAVRRSMRRVPGAVARLRELWVSAVPA
jgi:hypothetical protein